MRLRIAAAVALAVSGFMSAGGAEARTYVPGVKIVFEVRTPQGELRSYQRPGVPPTYWDQSFPSRQGDRVMLDALVATGGAELEAVSFALDGKPLVTLTKAPWRTEVDTKGLALGEHPLEATAKTAAPRSRSTTAKATLVVVAADERTGPAPAGDDEATERLSAMVGSLNPDLDAVLDAQSVVTLAGPELFYASAGPDAREFFYTLARNKQVFYTSPLLPITTYVQLAPQPAAAEGTPAAAGQEQLLAPGEVVLALQVGDGAGRFGPPAWASVLVEAQPETAPAKEATP